MKIIETDNYDGDYPDEKFVNLPTMTEEHATKVADAINDGFNDSKRDIESSRYWRVVKNDYKLRPGFTP